MRFTPSVPPHPRGIPGFSIPPAIQQIWIGRKPLPVRWAKFGRQIRALHPGWKYRLWTDADLPELFAAFPAFEPLYRQWTNYGYQSDILRLLILCLNGGVYLDTDCEVIRPLDALAAGCDAFCGATFPGEPFRQVLVQNAVLGACAGHPWLSLTLSRLREGLEAMGRDGRTLHAARADLMHILDLTGPGLLSRTLAEYRALPASYASDVRVVPARFLFPSGPDKPQSPAQYPDAFLLHRWDNSWGK